MTQIPVIYEDNHLLVVEKPVNLPVQADSSGDSDVLSLLKAYVKAKYDKPGDVYLGLVHRLDRPVGGVMVFARTSKSASRLTPQFGGRGAKKRYAAILCASDVREGRLCDYMVRDENTGNARIASENEPGAKSAVLYMTPIAERGGLTLVDIELHTGRHHQIRVQLASRKMPIYGDARYNPHSKPGQQIALWAYSLAFEHPTKKEQLEFTSLPHDKNSVWSTFDTELRAMMCGIRLAYADENVFAVNKARGMTVAMADCDEPEKTVEGRLRETFCEAFAVHRLDAATTGLVMLARNETARDELDLAIRQRSITKLYRCIVMGTLKKKEGTLTSYLVKDAAAARVDVFDTPVSGSKEAILRYRVIDDAKAETIGGTRVEVELVTGRTHQIRVQFAHIGHPLLGDDKYGDRQWNHTAAASVLAEKDTLCLCAVSIKTSLDKTSMLNYLNGIDISLTEPF